MVKPLTVSTTLAEPLTIIDTTVTRVTTTAPAAIPTKTVLNFEDSALLGLIPNSYFQSAVVNKQSLVTDQYIDKGIVIENAALVQLLAKDAPSGVMALAPVSAAGKIDYDAPVTLHFVREVDTTVVTTVDQTATSTNWDYSSVKGNGNSIITNNDQSDVNRNEHAANPANDHSVELKTSVATNSTTQIETSHTHVDGTVNYFAYSPDLDGKSLNTITLTAWDIFGHAMGSVSVREITNITQPIVLSGIGEFHSVTIDSTLRKQAWGGIALDDLTIGEVHTNVQPYSHTDVATAEVSLIGSYDPMTLFNQTWLPPVFP